jgi:hypothetical protein
MPIAPFDKPESVKVSPLCSIRDLPIQFQVLLRDAVPGKVLREFACAHADFRAQFWRRDCALNHICQRARIIWWNQQTIRAIAQRR